jgi:hypothetical protein
MCKRGFGKAAVLEGIRRCAALEATVAFVGSDQAFYAAICFKKIYSCNCWIKYRYTYQSFFDANVSIPAEESNQ